METLTEEEVLEKLDILNLPEDSKLKIIKYYRSIYYGTNPADQLLLTIFLDDLDSICNDDSDCPRLDLIAKLHQL